MAIRPADLQLAYMAAPQSAAVAAIIQDGPQTAQAAAEAAFAAQMKEREESIEEGAKLEGNVVRPRGEEPRDGLPHKREDRRHPQDEADPNALNTSGDGEHLIDFTA